MGLRPISDKDIERMVSDSLKMDENRKKKSSAGNTTQKKETSSTETSVSSSSAETESLGKEDFSLSEASETSQSMTQVVDDSPNVTPSAETKSGENRLGYIAILLILAMIFIVCLQRFLSERRVEKECDGFSRHGKSLRDKKNV